MAGVRSRCTRGARPVPRRAARAPSGYATPVVSSATRRARPVRRCGASPEGRGGRPVLELESLAVRPIDPERLGAAARAGGDSLFRCEWVELALGEDAGPPERYAVVGAGVELPGDVPGHPDLDALLAAIEQGAG